MPSTKQHNLFNEEEANQAQRATQEDWTFYGASTRELTHCYHDYPARMIPQVAGKLLDKFAPKAMRLFDPYCGTGTSLVEGLVRGMDGIGTDLNPLARLIARAKTSFIESRLLDATIADFLRFLSAPPPPVPQAFAISGIKRLDFWFKPEVIETLAHIKSFIDAIDEEATRRFFQIAFSETVRESSNTRNDEFKLYRYDAERLANFRPNVGKIIASKLSRNRAGLQSFVERVRQHTRRPQATVCDFDSVLAVPASQIALQSIDIILTSPPYGDSPTTVAYGQYSRLSAAWLGLSEPDKIDNRLMGGKSAKRLAQLPSPALQQAVEKIAQADHKRAREVAAFYHDLQHSIANLSPTVKSGGHVCYVVGNRKVKGVALPTHQAIKDFFTDAGFDHVETFQRAIPNKRMPLKNSPTNIAGTHDSTMLKEYIVVLRQPARMV